MISLILSSPIFTKLTVLPLDSDSISDTSNNTISAYLLKNLLIISKNVVYTNPTNILKADVVELDTITNDIKIFMHNSKDKVNIESRN